MLAYFLFKLSKIDLEIRQIPDNYSLAICIFAVGAGGFPLSRVCLGMAIMLISALIMGLGDAKLFGALSLLFGWRILLVIFISFILAALYCIAAMLCGKLSFRDSIAFAPFISVASLGLWYSLLVTKM